ncbi:RICIN domain-containing protein [Anaeromicropila populeti]|uniref:Arabinan endo-1,5-alpha-L-arabinosidase n=1 Tax=Anaeromicropila populeti TaxID=37658 RepID=A0A1I6IQ61_9FIRM|nr:RICIN domain-containing protein [Anaeromicropila populeti]SFR68873.1 arabinan endo-1,5-alpha-L-arabinosidase [Anaeromicropila populeti]
MIVYTRKGMKKFLKKVIAVSLIGMFVFTLVLQHNENTIKAAAGTTKRVSVHDPSIFRDPKSGKYYIFGSHLGQASSTNIMDWSYLGTQGYSNRSVYGSSTTDSLLSALSESFTWAGYNDQDSSGGYAVWAPDIIWNGSYSWSDGTKGAYMMYYCTSSTYIRSCIGYAVSKSVEGPFKHVDTIVYSGFTLKDNYITTSSSLGSKTINTKYTNTNVSTLISKGTLSGYRSGWFNANGSYNNCLFPNAIDPNLTFDSSGRMWMSYGSWSGGIYLLELNPATGQPIYPGYNSGNTDAYFGTRIAGGYYKSGEAPYIVYDKTAGYYYLYITYGGLANSGGYHIRMYRSTNISGPYKDAAGNSAIYSSTSNQANLGVKLFGNYDFSSLSVGYKSGGHNSAFINTDGSHYLVYHTRFNNGSEMHEVRVHQQFLNQDGWLVTAPYEYLGSKISASGYSLSDMAGTYEFIDHGLDASTSNVGMLPTTSITLSSNGTISGAISGTWSYTSGSYYVTMIIGGITYKGVFFKQYNESSSHNEVMTFSVIGKNNKALWGSKTKDEASVVTEGTYYIQNVNSGLYLDVADGSASDGTNIQQWEYNGSDAQKFKVVSNGNGYYHILTGASGYTSCIDIENGSTSNGTNVLQWTYHGGDMQQYYITKHNDGSYAFLTKASGSASAIEIYDFSTANGGNANQWTYWGGNAQHWKLIPAGSTGTNMSWNMQDSGFKGLGTISSSVTVNQLALHATSAKTMQVYEASQTLNGTTYGYCLALGGTGNTSYRSASFPVSGACSIVVTGKSSGTSSRTLLVADANGNQLGTFSMSTSLSVQKFTYSGNSNTIYLYSSNSGINIYDIDVVY